MPLGTMKQLYEGQAGARLKAAMLQCPVLATGVYAVQKLGEVAFDKNESDEVRYSALEAGEHGCAHTSPKSWFG